MLSFLFFSVRRLKPARCSERKVSYVERLASLPDVYWEFTHVSELASFTATSVKKIRSGLHVGNLYRIAILVFSLVGGPVGIGLPDPTLCDFESGKIYVEGGADRINLSERVDAISLSNFLTAGGQFCDQEADIRTRNPKIRKPIFVIRVEFVMKIPS
jgi:hypothetical protein